MRTAITMSVLIAVILSCFGVSVSADDNLIPCDYTALTEAGFSGKGIWRIHHRDGVIKKHLSYGRILSITQKDGDIFVEAMGQGNANFPKEEKWTGKCAEGKYVLEGYIDVKNGDEYTCRHELVITRAVSANEHKPDEVNTTSSPSSQIIIKSTTSHSDDLSCENHLMEAHDEEVDPQPPTHLGHAHGGND